MNVNRFVRPIILTGMLVLAAWVLARSPLPQVAAQSQVVGSGPYRAGIVFRFEDGRVESRCVAFEEQEINGLELLEKSGIGGVATTPLGAVCSINGQGCPSDNCFCQCPFPDCKYWAYYHRENGAWQYAQDGQMYAIIRDGSLDGWSWGEGDFSHGVEPPQVNFDQVCPATTGGATATATATTDAGAPAAPPQVSFAAASASVAAGQCTTLNWQTTGATAVTLDGVSVPFQGSQQVCPNASQAWTLVAQNGAGQTSRQVSVTVQAGGYSEGSPAASPTLTPTTGVAGTPTSRPTATAPRQSTPTSSAIRTPRPLITQAPRPQPGATVAGAFPIPPTAELHGGVPLAPTAALPPAMTPSPEATATRYQFALPPTETPRPRRVLAADEPTPTPLLVAHADVRAAGGSAPSASSARPSVPSQAVQSAPSRAFTPNLLPGYAAYVVSVAVLLIMGWYVLRRHEQVRAGKDE